GPVGLLGAALLVLRGCRTVVYSAEPEGDPKAKAALSLGAEYVSAKACPLDQLPARIPPVDVVYEATGASQFAFDSMEMLGPNGVFILTGVPGRKGTIDIPGGDIMRRLVLYNQLVYGTVNAPRSAFEAAARDLETLRTKRPGAVEALISGRHALEDFAEPLAGRLPGIKHVLKVAA
ncbi:MAG: zinc-binding dehydrogenase, partial [Elusimicrobia bacterium]|nr:zinc-binding dehydrogenase [Elusimicrobiota bacterium]